MYLRRPKKLHLELTDKCNAKCPMCVRTNPNGLGETDVVVRTELTYEDLKEFPKEWNHINYCGNYGDPLLAKDLLKILKHFEGSHQLIHTNGSLRNEEFWKELAQIKNLKVMFGIDGANTISHSKYRVNTSFEKILKNAKVFNSAGGHSIWQMILFEHNQNEVEDAKKIAKQYGFKRFETLKSRRFFEKESFTYSYKGDIIELRPSSNMEIGEEKPIVCKAKVDEEIYIDAQGYVWPCCYVTKEKLMAPNIRKVPFNELFYDSFFDFIDLNKNSFQSCRMTCGYQYRNQRIKTPLDDSKCL